MCDLLTQLNKIKDKKFLMNQSFCKFIKSVNDRNDLYLSTEEEIDLFHEELSKIKVLKDNIIKELKTIYFNTPDEKLPELIDNTEFKFYDDFEILKELGYPKIRYLIPILFEMLLDSNWPCSYPAKNLLIEIGEPIINHIKILFERGLNPINIDDYYLIEVAITKVIPELSSDSIIKIKSELIQRIEFFDYSGNELSNYAFVILFLKSLISKEEISTLLSKNQKMNYVLIMSTDLINDKDKLIELSDLIFEINNFEENSFLNYLEKTNQKDLINQGKTIVSLRNKK